MKTVVAQVAVAETAFHFDKPYDYLVPEPLVPTARPGCRVLAPFGKGNRKRQGVIMSLGPGEDILKLKPISEVLDKSPVLSGEMIKLGIWLKEHTFCTLFDAYRAMLPAGISLRMEVSYRIAETADESAAENPALSADERRMLSWLMKSRVAVSRDRLMEIMGLDEADDMPERLCKKGLVERLDGAVRRVGDATVQMARLKEDYDPEEEQGLTDKQKSVINLLRDAGSASVKELIYFAGVTRAVPDTLHKKGIIEYFESEVYRRPYDITPPENTADTVLTGEQSGAYESLLSLYEKKNGGVSLLYGVTGSGKTQVFLRLIDHVIKDRRSVIVMVPEIALTPQTLSLFYARYGGRVAVFHSAMSLGQRVDEWKRMKSGEAVIAVGTRSAVFAPCDNLGLIIMDEEQEHTYKSEASPRFHAGEVARFRAAFHGGMLLLASATPGIGTYSAAKTGRCQLVILSKRYGGARLPRVITADMREEIMRGNTGVFSATLTESLSGVLKDGKQAILLLNRRGHNTFVSCRSCGHVMTCPQCSISLTYHSANGRLLCHYCGFSRPLPESCPECGGGHIKYAGCGTQRAQQELEGLFPQAKILRMDADTTLSRFAHERKFAAFAAGEYNIMLGTQMVAKGLDFPGVTLVGVLNADGALYSEDYRAYERAFSLLTQVVGRSGRGNDPGIAVIQTMTPENPVIQLAAQQDYDKFYEREILTRKLMIYPPYCDICMAGFVSQDHEQAKRAAQVFFGLMKRELAGEYAELKVIVLGPGAAGVPKVSGKYRYRLIIKCRNTRRFREMMAVLLRIFGKMRDFKDTSAYADMNPYNIL